MRYGYEDADINSIISYYKIDGNNLIITYLSGKEDIVSKEKEDEIITIMLKQAIERQEKCTLATAIRNEKDNMELFSIKFLIATSFFAGGAAINSENWALGLTVAGAYSAFMAILDGSQMIDLHKRTEELKKYKLFLSHLNDLERLKNDKSIYKGVEATCPLNINTIDGFTYSDVKKISLNIDKRTNLKN